MQQTYHQDVGRVGIAPVQNCVAALAQGHSDTNEGGLQVCRLVGEPQYGLGLRPAPCGGMHGEQLLNAPSSSRACLWGIFCVTERCFICEEDYKNTHCEVGCLHPTKKMAAIVKVASGAG